MRVSHPAAPSRLSFPGQRQQPETPPPPTSQVSTRKYALLATEALLPTTPEAQFQPRARGGGGAVLGGRTTYGRKNMNLQAVASRSPGAVCLPCASPGPQTRAIPTSKMAATAAPTVAQRPTVSLARPWSEAAEDWSRALRGWGWS